jgi:Glycosyltransferase
MGVLPSLDSLSQLYRNADFGLVFSPTNPSLVPFEMLACGCPVGDLDFDRAIEKYGSDAGNVFLLPITPQALGRELARIFDNPAEMKQRSDAGRRYVEAHFPSDAEMIRQIERFIIQKINSIEEGQHA